MGEKAAYFPIRAIDFDPSTGMLYTGDEMGYMNKWNISKVVEKCQMMKPREEISQNLSDNEKEAQKKISK